jgi:RNA polymerase sigma factor (sigma-70 family)
LSFQPGFHIISTRSGFPKRVATHNPYTEHQDTIESVLTQVCRQKRLSADDRDEFSSVVRLKLIEDDYAILRKFSGLSSFKGYITVVINRQLLDWRIKDWGKWRPTPRALELGALAVDLERMVLRDGLEYGQAVQTLISMGSAASEMECDELWKQLRRKGRRKRVDIDDHFDVPAPAHDSVIDNERRELARRLVQALRVALAALLPDEQLLFKMRYYDRFTVARIAKHVDEEQKPLYRRFEQLERRLKASILATGIAEQDILDLFDSFELADDEDEGNQGNGGSGPSTSLNAGGVRV